MTWATISREAFEQTGASDEETEGFINPVRAVRGAEVGILFREVERGRVRISLRSTDRVDVSKIAAGFGGGGHRMASGCTFEGSLENAVAAITKAVTEALPAK